jgi:hypothetical protein
MFVRNVFCLLQCAQEHTLCTSVSSMCELCVGATALFHEKSSDSFLCSCLNSPDSASVQDRHAREAAIKEHAQEGAELQELRSCVTSAWYKTAGGAVAGAAVGYGSKQLHADCWSHSLRVFPTCH